MKKRFSLHLQRPVKCAYFLCSVLWCAAAAQAHGHDHAKQADNCIAANSGADSVECLEKLLYETKAQIGWLENSLHATLRHALKIDDIGNTHFLMGATGLRDASKKFYEYSERQCDFDLGLSGAGASGSGQVYYSCLIRLNDDRANYLERIVFQARGR